MIQLAETSDAKILTKIALKSKSFWGYSNEILESWVEDLTVSERIIQEMIVYKFISDNEDAEDFKPLHKFLNEEDKFATLFIVCEKIIFYLQHKLYILIL